MTLGYEFQPIDVDLTDHPRVRAIQKRYRRAAFGLYVDGLCYARKHKTNGRLPATFAEDDDPKLAAELLRVGLWVTRDDGAYDIHNWEKKSAGTQTSSTERMRRLRAKRRSGDAENDVTGDAGDVTCDASRDVTSVTRCSSSLSNSSGSDLSQADQINLPGGSRPPWADDVFESAEMATGEKFDRGTVWFTYANARADETPPRPVSQTDFGKYLGSWASNQKQKRINTPKGRGAEITKQPYDENAPWMKLPEVG